MGERTSAVVNSRTSMPQNKLAVNSDAMARGTESYSSRIPDVPLMYERTEPQIAPREIAGLLAQNKSTEEWDEIINLATHQPVYKPIVLDMPELHLERNAAATVQASALMVADEQAAAGCCPCLPCNLL